MALTRAAAGAMTHAELVDLVDLVVRQSGLIAQLQAVIARQQALIATLEARIRDLERQLAQRERDDPTQQMLGLTPAATPRRRKEGPRKRRPHGFSRRLSRAPTETEVIAHAVEHCPACQTPLSGGTERWRKEVLDAGPAAGAARAGDLPRLPRAHVPRLWAVGAASRPRRSRSPRWGSSAGGSGWAASCWPSWPSGAPSSGCPSP